MAGIGRGRSIVATLVPALAAILALGFAASAEATNAVQARHQHHRHRHHHLHSHRADAGSHRHGQRHRAGSSKRSRALLTSPELWATVDVCRGGKSPMIGIRASMPGDGHRHDSLYMRFRVQYLESSTGKWKNLPGSTGADFVDAGSADATRQSGETFELARPERGASFKLRGLVELQWRRHKKLLLSALRPTTSEHHSKFGSNPPGFSAATCTIG